MESTETFKRLNAVMATQLKADLDRALNFYTGYNALERGQINRFNRCCHPGRKIVLKPRPMTIRVGKPAVRIRKFSHEMAVKIAEMSQ